jgi:hypothetical protein
MPAIPDTQVVEAAGSQIQDQSEQLSQTTTKTLSQNKIKRARNIAQ